MEHIKQIIKDFKNKWKYCGKCEYYTKNNVKCNCKEKK